MNIDINVGNGSTKWTTFIPDDGDDLFQQLITWQKAGFIPELHSVLNNQWVLVLASDHWSNQGRLDEHSHRMGLRFNTDPCDTPQDAIRAAMKVIR